jgi:hypothetical protein
VTTKEENKSHALGPLPTIWRSVCDTKETDYFFCMGTFVWDCSSCEDTLVWNNFPEGHSCPGYPFSFIWDYFFCGDTPVWDYFCSGDKPVCDYFFCGDTPVWDYFSVVKLLIEIIFSVATLLTGIVSSVLTLITGITFSCGGTQWLTAI